MFGAVLGCLQASVKVGQASSLSGTVERLVFDIVSAGFQTGLKPVLRVCRKNLRVLRESSERDENFCRLVVPRSQKSYAVPWDFVFRAFFDEPMLLLLPAPELGEEDSQT